MEKIFYAQLKTKPETVSKINTNSASIGCKPAF